MRRAPSLPRLERAVRGQVTTDPEALLTFGHDASHLSGRPRAVVAPADPDDVAALVRWARRTHTSLVPRGGGTSLDGESVPENGAVVVDLSGWSRVLEVDAAGLSARVQPGVVNRDLQEALHPHGVFFPPNPGSWTVSTVGGNVGTNASGMRSFRYGPTRAWVREVEAVLGTGARVRLGSRVAKRSVGPDLLQLFIGSEGTLGVATEVTLRLAPLPPVRRGAVVPLPPTASCGELARRLTRLPSSGISAVEYLDRGCVTAIAERRDVGWPTETALLLIEVEAEDPDDVAHRLDGVRRALRESGVTGEFTVVGDADELWTARGTSGDVLVEQYGHHVREDVAVPLAHLDALIDELDRIARRENVPYRLFGHLGEGSLHPNYVVDPASRTGGRIRAAVLRASRRLDGTISAEHGIGRLKRPYLAEELGAAAVDLLYAVKRACDPDGILNPGKLYPPRRGAQSLSRSPSEGGGGTARRASPSGVGSSSSPRTKAFRRVPRTRAAPP